jgi:hypothetical protein
MVKKSSVHFVGMAGLHGCLPQYTTCHKSYLATVSDLAEVHELSKARRRELRRDGYLELNLHRDGNEYIEIVKCSCASPEIHEEV